MKSERFRVACQMLRLGGLPKSLPVPGRSESPVDYLVRSGLAKDLHVAAEMLLLGAGLTALADEMMSELETGDAK